MRGSTTDVEMNDDDFIRKPFREADIFGALTRHLGVRFVYEDGGGWAVEGDQRERVKGYPKEVLTPAALAALPAVWVAELRRATIDADLELILTLIDQIREQDAILDNVLAELAYNFDHDTILIWLSQNPPSSP